MTLFDTADAINALFRSYGLTHDVVTVMEWKRLDPDDLDEPEQELALVGAEDPAVMQNLLITFTELFRGYFEVYPPTGQLRLF